MKVPISLFVLALVLAPMAGAAAPKGGIAMHGEPKEPADFSHFPYVNADAPKGGRLILARRGSYDSLNPLIVKGESAEGVRDYVYESLLTRSYDEPFSLYGLIAETRRGAGGSELRRVHAATRRPSSPTASQSRSTT